MKKCIIIPMLLFFFYAFGQSNIKTYSGEMITPKDILGLLIDNATKGKGIYSYYERENGERVKHGKFEFIYYCNNKNSVSGQYSNGKKEGVWNFLTYGFSNQIYDKFSVTYKGDSLNGAYKFILYYILSVPSIICSGNLFNGYNVGDVKIETPNSKGFIKVFFNERGWAHGMWQIERKDGIPLKQEREYFEGILLRVVELDLSSGEKKVLFEQPKETITQIKSTFNVSNSTLMISGEKFKRIKDDNNNDFDSRLFQNSTGSKSVEELFNDSDSPTISEFLPLCNGFARLEKVSK